MTSHTDNDERQPLLPESDQPLCDESISQTDPSDHSKVWQWIHGGTTTSKDFLFEHPILICTFCLQFCTYFAKHMVEVPIIKLFEQAICNRYYAAHGELYSIAGEIVDEKMCKIAPIQDELATLTGLKFTFDALPGNPSRCCCTWKLKT